jgi:hypothetical protein
MSFQNQPSLKGTLQQLKEIVTCLQGEDHESTRLLSQMETLVSRIENKTKRPSKESKESGLTIKPTATPAQVLS